MLVIINIFYYQDAIRQQQAEAAERRLAANERRGIGNVEAVKRQQRQAEERDKRETAAGNMDNQPGLKVNLIR